MFSSLFVFIFLILLTLVSSFFSLSQISLFSISSNLISHYKVSKNHKERILAFILSHPHHLLASIIFCDIAINILIQNTAAILFDFSSSWWLKVGCPLMLTLVFGEIIPKAIAVPLHQKIAPSIAPIIGKIQKVMSPLLNWIIMGMNYLVNSFIKNPPHSFFQEIKEILNSYEDHGIITKDESYLIYGYLSLNDCIVKERMHPRNEILFYNIQQPLHELFYLFEKKQCSRVPICNADIQNIIGICSAKNFLLHSNKITSNHNLLEILTKPYYIPEMISAKKALSHLIAKNETMGIVIDEYGSVSGIITQEDLFEIVVGEIIDRRDEKVLYTRPNQDIIIASGKLDLLEVEQIFHVSLPNPNNLATIGGWITEQLETIPIAGSQFIWKNLLFQVLDSAPNRVRRIYVRKLTNV